MWPPRTREPGSSTSDPGGGVPGIVIAILRPDLAMTLIDADRRKSGFLIHVAGLLGLTCVHVVAERAEDAGRRGGHARDVRPGDLASDGPAVGPLRAGAAAAPHRGCTLRPGQPTRRQRSRRAQPLRRRAAVGAPEAPTAASFVFARLRLRPTLIRGDRAPRAGIRSAEPALDRRRRHCSLVPRDLAVRGFERLLVTLARAQYGVSRSRVRHANPIASSRSGNDEEIRPRSPPADTAPAAICSRISARSSPRGSSSVMTLTSASRAATAPIAARFSTSRSPADPKTAQSLPAVVRRSSCSTVSSASVVCA